MRVVRACADAGLESVAVFSPEDRDAAHVRLADSAYALDGVTVTQTYLSCEAYLAAAAKSGADAVHPGYGFLAESPAFARAVQQAGLTWIGPSPEALETLGSKLAARALAASVGAPLVPASAVLRGGDDLARFAGDHGLPVLIKAAHGGGGRGMRVLHHLAGADEALAGAQREALASFGNADCFAETYLQRPHHIETQCLADRHGTVAVVSTRDCTVQRRHQKLIEEAPAPGLDQDQLDQITTASRRILQAAAYQGAATVEFLVGPDGAVYFIEVNPRLQVEHPVTEEVTGVDLVREQFRIADGQALGYDSVPVSGHAIEFRLNAEDPANGFLPAPGTITALRLPGGPGVRCDFGYQGGDTLTGSYDSLIGKLIVHGQDRAQALERARRALREFQADGVATTCGFHCAVVDSPDFAALTIHTGWLEAEFAPVIAALPAATPHDAALPEPAATARMVVEVDGKRLEVVVPSALVATAAPASGPATPRRTTPKPAGTKLGQGADGQVVAPMQGTVVQVVAKAGQTVSQGEVLVVLEAMKMEQPLAAPHDGVVTTISATPGERVLAGQVLAVVQAASAE